MHIFYDQHRMYPFHDFLHFYSRQLILIYQISIRLPLDTPPPPSTPNPPNLLPPSPSPTAQNNKILTCRIIQYLVSISGYSASSPYQLRHTQRHSMCGNGHTNSGNRNTLNNILAGFHCCYPDCSSCPANAIKMG